MLCPPFVVDPATERQAGAAVRQRPVNSADAMPISGVVALEAAADAVAPGAAIWVVHESEQRRRPDPLCSGHFGQLVGDDPAGWSGRALPAVVPRGERVRLALESFEGVFRVQQVLVVAL